MKKPGKVYCRGCSKFNNFFSLGPVVYGCTVIKESGFAETPFERRPRIVYYYYRDLNEHNDCKFYKPNIRTRIYLFIIGLLNKRNYGN